MISSFYYEIIPFPDEFWKRTELLRGKIRDNWEGESKPRQDLFLNFEELKNLYDKKGTRRIGCSGRWNGHVIIVLDSMHVIESRPGCPGFKGGVVVTPLKERLTEIMQERVPTDDPALAAEPNGRTFVVRPWYYSSNMAAGNKVSTSEAACDVLDAVPSITELPKKFGESTQLLMVSSCHPKSICATVQAFQREGKQWRPVFSAMQAVNRYDKTTTA